MKQLEVTVTVKTPQHKDGKVFDYTVQSGYIDRDFWLFEPVKYISGKVGMHRIDFGSEENFKKYQVL